MGLWSTTSNLFFFHLIGLYGISLASKACIWLATCSRIKEMQASRLASWNVLKVVMKKAEKKDFIKYKQDVSPSRASSAKPVRGETSCLYLTKSFFSGLFWMQ